MVTVIATIIAKKDKIEEVKTGLGELVKHTTQEADCIKYILHQDRENPAVFMFYEQFKDQAAFDFHASQPYIATFSAKSSELLEQPAKLRFLNLV